MNKQTDRNKKSTSIAGVIPVCRRVSNRALRELGAADVACVLTYV